MGHIKSSPPPLHCPCLQNDINSAEYLPEVTLFYYPSLLPCTGPDTRHLYQFQRLVLSSQLQISWSLWTHARLKIMWEIVYIYYFEKENSSAFLSINNIGINQTYFCLNILNSSWSGWKFLRHWSIWYSTAD